MPANTTIGRQALIRERLENVGLKATPQRLTVLQAMLTHERRHLSAGDVYQRITQQEGRVGMATIYRVLGQLTGVGILARHIFDAESGRAVYEVQEGAHHDHFFCVRCGKVDEFVDEVIAARNRKVAASLGYTLAVHELKLYGHCAACNSAKRNAKL